MKIERIFLRNFLIIKKSEITPSFGLTVITGETGSGKSLFVTALKVLRGERVGKNIVGKWGEQAEISAEILIEEGDIQLKEDIASSDLILDVPDRLIVKRVIGTKNGCYIDGAPVPLTTLQQILAENIEIGSQFENRELFKKDYRIAVVDRIARNEQYLKEYREIYRNIKDIENEIKELSDKDNPVRRDYLEYQINEISKIATYENEEKELEEKISYFENRSKIEEFSSEIVSIMDEVSSSLSRCALLSERLSALTETESFAQRVKSLSIDAEDVARSSTVLNKSADFENEDINEIKNRHDNLFRVLMKHGLSASEQLIKKEYEMNEELYEINKVPQKMEELEKALEKLKKSAFDKAMKLREKRIPAIKSLEEKILKYLKKFAMGGVKFSVEMGVLEEFCDNGLDSIEFKVNTIGTQEMYSVSSLSGGELSRLLLAMKLLDEESGKVLLFDEIDSNIGGETAKNAAAEMLVNSAKNQIMTVTHFPQTASAGQTHILVEKSTADSDVTASIKVLSKEERIGELARMMGDGASKDLLLTAEKMLGERNDR